jgi:hypothetical protein
MMTYLLYLLLAVLGLVIASLVIVAAVALLISTPLIVLLLLQAVGLIRRVPLGYNIRNLAVRWKTTLMTGLAFTLVVGVVLVLLAFVNGLYALTKASAVPGNLMVLADGATDEVFSDLGYGDITQLETRSYVKRASIPEVTTDRLVPLVSWELYQIVSHEIPNSTRRRLIQVRGLEDPVISAFVHDLNLKPGGQWFDPGAGVQTIGGDKEPHVQAVLGEGVARVMGHDRGKETMAIGDTFQLGPRKWVVVGIMNSNGKTFDSEVWAKRKVVGEMLRKDTRSTAVIRVADGLDPVQTAQDMTQDFKSPAIQARTEADYFESISQTNQVFLYASLFVAAITAIGGIFGVMNTMFAAISQRTREIGMLRILGFSRWQVLSSFFLESLVLALIGGLLGCALAYLFNGLSLTSQISAGQGGGKSVVLKLIVDGWLLGFGLLFSLAMGCIGGLLPSLSAIRLKVLDSLR